MLIFLIFIPYSSQCGELVYFDPDLAMELISKLDFVEEENRAFNERVSVINEEMRKMQQELTDMEKELSRLKELEMKNDFESLAKVYSEKFKVFEKYFEESNNEISEKRKSIQKEIETSLIAIVNEIATKKNYEMVIEYGQGNIILANPELDITSRVVEAYKSNYRDVHDEIDSGKKESPPTVMTAAETRLYHLGYRYLEENNPGKAAMVWQRMISQTGKVHYSIALHSDCNIDIIKSELEKLSDYSPSFFLPLPMSSKPCYRILYGLFKTKAEAQKELDSLIQSHPEYFKAYLMRIS